MPSQVLIYGNDATLLRTRCLVLELHGVRAVSVNSLEEVDQISRVDDVALLILCHTLSSQECGYAISAARANRPSVKSLLLTASLLELDPEAQDEVLSIFEGPRVFLETVDKMLNTLRKGGKLDWNSLNHTRCTETGSSKADTYTNPLP